MQESTLHEDRDGGLNKECGIVASAEPVENSMRGVSNCCFFFSIMLETHLMVLETSIVRGTSREKPALERAWLIDHI